MEKQKERQLTAAQAKLFKRLPSQFSPLQLVKTGYGLGMEGAEIEEALRVYRREGLVEGNVSEGYRKADREGRE